MLLAVDLDDTVEATLEVLVGSSLAIGGSSRRDGTVGGDVVIDEVEARVVFEVVGVDKEVLDLGGLQLTAQSIRLFLYDLAEGDLETTRHIELESALDDPGDTALARLAVDTDDGLVSAADILRVERKVGDLPACVVVAAVLLAQVEALLDGVLVTARESAHDELAAVRGSGMDRDLVALLDNVDDRVDVAEVDVGRHTLSVEVQGKGDKIDVSSSFAVSKEGALDTVGACHLSELCSSYGAASVVVGMERDADLLTLRNVAAEVLDLVGVDVGCRHLDGSGQVEDDGVILGRLPGSLDGLADLEDKVWVGVGEGLGGELVGPFCALLLGVVLGDAAGVFGAFYGEGLGLFVVHVEDNLLEARAGGQVQVENGLFGALERVDGAADELLAAW